VIAHRGLALAAPENTLAAFAAALEAGATHLETDVHATRDGEAVILHDPDLRRILDDPSISLTAATATLGELRAAAGDRVQICTLFELLQTFPSALVNIDIKAAAAAAPAAAAIRAAGALDRVLVTSFSRSRRRSAVLSLPGAATSASALELAAAVLAARLHLSPLVECALHGVDAVQMPERVLGISTTTPPMIRTFHRAGVEVHVWTINDEAAMRRLLEAGVDGIVTDRSDRLVEVLESRS
jgi:glycerophosphoryl diester phosphodiesterase